MDTLGHVFYLKPVSNLAEGIIKIIVIGIIHVFFFEGSDEAFHQSILRGLPGVRHAYIDASILQQVNILPGGILVALIGMMNERRWVICQSIFQSSQG